MDDKDLKNEELKNDDVVDNEEIAEKAAEASEQSNWEFDGEAPTLDREIKLDSEYEVDIPEDSLNTVEISANNESSAVALNPEQAKKQKKTLKIVAASFGGAIILAAIITLFVFIFGMPNSNETMTPGNVALKIGDTKVSVGMYNYYYNGTVQNYLQSAQYGYYDIDPEKDFAEQMTTDDDGNEITWLERFEMDTISQIQYNLAYYGKAVEEGVTLTEDQKTQIDEQLESIKDSAASIDMSVGAYLEDSCGEYCGLETIRKIFEQSRIASNYYQQVTADNQIDEDKYNEFFEENQDKYLSAKFSYIEIMGTGTDEASLAKLEEDVKNYQSQIKDAASLKAIIPTACDNLIEQYISYNYFANKSEAIKALEKASEATIACTKLEQDFGKEIVDWLVSDDVPIGSTRYIIDKDYGFACIFLKTDKPFFNDKEMYSVRHILVMPESASADENADPSKIEYTQEEWDAALAKANEILDEYNKGEKTEISFALLAEAKSDDKQSTSNGTSGFYGGAIEGVSLGEMVPEFEGWATDKSRKYGDVDIVKSQFGYHIMFFIFDGPEYKLNALSDFKKQNIAEFEKTLAEEYEIDKKIGLKKADVAEPVTSKAKEETSDNAE